MIGLDLSPHYLVLAQKLLAEHGLRDVPLFCADIRDGLPIPLDVYDIGFISMDGVLEHIKDASKFLETLSKIESDPLVIYLTVPYRWTWQRESHFDLRGVGWLPRFLQDRYIAWRLGVASIAHVELYSKTSLRRLLKRYFYLSWIIIERNSNDPRKSHYLKCTIYRSKNAIKRSHFYNLVSIIGRNYIGIRIGRLLLRIPVIGPLIKTSLKKLG